MSVAALIRREGPITFDRFMEAALYGEDGFFSSGRGARRDFVTSVGVGSLFGACVARALDRCWHALDAPDPFLVVEAGAGDGALARDVLRAEPECLRALRYVLVERSAQLRTDQRTRVPLDPPDEALGPFVRTSEQDAPLPASGAGPVCASLGELPSVHASAAVVLANELLDNLPFGIAEWDGTRWNEIRVALDGERFVESPVPLEEGEHVAGAPADPRPGTRVPLPRGLYAWFDECDRVLRHGFVVCIDYMTDAPQLHLRTYRNHRRGTDPLDAPGTRDITADVVTDQLRRAAAGFRVVTSTTQADWLRELGIEQLADAGAARWRAGAHRGDLDALAGRSAVHETEMLTDPAGLGAHRVVVLERERPR